MGIFTDSNNGEMVSVKITENDTKGKSLKVICLNCEIETNHQVLTSIEEEGFDEKNDYHWNFIYQIIKCNGCECLSFREERFDSEMASNNEKQEEILYPERSEKTITGKTFYALPDNINTLYHEVIDCYNRNILILCAAGIRALVEAICLEKKIVDGIVDKKDSDGNNERKNNLEGKINGLAEKGILTKEHADILQNHRFLGNEAIHEISIHNKETLKTAINIIEDILNYIYEIPDKGEKLKRTKNRKEV